ncbi:hypothetical protein GOP47_0010143 [Adiantum capillus-veneris]|uniref:Uncharacterized protein n=1 Tax=Adiantum capillus-veneris TaxID=13818 RepID=A0A9D4ZHH5_ADICA|nr:hypothetical protein GOP47_0010143 [Adiantum capillus-veneris]
MPSWNINCPSGRARREVAASICSHMDVRSSVLIYRLERHAVGVFFRSRSEHQRLLRFRWIHRILLEVKRHNNTNKTAERDIEEESQTTSMEKNYRNNSIAQEGCPSLDFTLLDRPSSSTVSAPGSTAPLFPGENPLSSFDFVDGAGVESNNDRSFPGHRSYMAEAANNPLRRNVSMQVGPLQRQGLGEHYFFGQDNQQLHSRVGGGEGHVQSQSISQGDPNPEQSGQGNMPMEYSLVGKAQSSQFTMPSGNTGSLFSSIHGVHPSAGAYLDDRRNQVPFMQQYPSESHNTSLKFSNFLPVNSGTLEHQSNAINIASASGLHHQDQSRRYASQNIAGNGANETLNITFPTNQLPNGPTPVPPEAQPVGATRGFGMTELQLLRQQALQSKQQQALQFKQQQALRLQQQEAMRVQQEEAARQQQKMQHEAVMAQKQEAFRIQRQEEAMRLQQQELMQSQQQELMQSQQQEVFRMQQQAFYLQQQGAARTDEQNAVLWSQDQAGRLSKLHNTVPLERQQAIWSQQQKAVWGQQESAEQRENLQSQQQWARLTQQTLPSHQQVSSSNQHQALQSQKGQAVPHQQPHLFQNHPRLSSFQQQHAMRFQQQQALQTQQQQAPQSQQKHAASLEHLTLQSQQELFEPPRQVVSQETSVEFPGTSYSALLHGPDTPPHTQSGGGTLFPDLESNATASPTANTQTVVWPTYGSSSYRGLPKEYSMRQNSLESQNLRPLLHCSDDHNFALADGEGRQSTQSAYPFVGCRAASPVKPSFEFTKPAGANAEVGGFGSIGYSPSDARSKHQVPANTSPPQTSDYSGQPNGLFSGPIQTDLLSRNQQHFQGLQSSQQRSWERLVQKHGVSKPNFPEVVPSLSQGISTIEKSTLERGFQQNFSSTGTIRTSPGHNSQHLRSVNPSGCKQHQVFTSTVGEVARTIMDEGGRQFPDSRNIITDQHAGYHSRDDSDSNNDTYGNRVAHLPTPMVRIPVHSGSPSHSMSQAMLNINQGTHLNMQVPPKTMAVSNTLSSQGNIVWKENDMFKQTSSYFSEPAGYSQGFWKQHASFPESVSGLDSSCEPPNRHVNDSIWKQNFQSHKSNLDTQNNIQAASLTSMTHRERDNGAQLMYEKQLLGHGGVFQQMHNTLGINEVGSQSVANPVEAFIQGTTRLQGSTVDKCRLPELPMDPSSSRSVSLAHLRQSQPSSPLSPQHVKLGLGPANLPQKVQQVCNLSAPTSSQIDGSYQENHGTSFNMEDKKFLAGTRQAGSGKETPAGNRMDTNQGITASGNGLLLQNNARPSSALSNSSSFSRESADSEALPPVNVTRVVEGSDFSQGTTSLTGHAFQGVGTNAGYFEQESSSNSHGNLKPPADNNKKPPHSAGSSNQGTYSTGPRHANMDAGSLRVLQNQQIINMALKQLGNKTQVANLAGLLTTLKTSLSEHSKNSADHEKLLSGPGESGRLPSLSAQEDGTAPSLMQSRQMMWRKLSGPALEACSPEFKATSLDASNEYNQNCKFKQEEVSEATTGLCSDLQRQSRESLLINGSKSQLGGQAARLSVLRTLNSIPSQVESQMRDSNVRLSTFGEDQYLQQQGLLLHQVSKEATAGTAQTARLTNTADAVDKPIEAHLKPFKSTSIQGYLGKAAIGQGDGTSVDTAMELEKAKQQKSSASEFASERSLQSVVTLPSRHRQLSKQIAFNAVIGSPSPCTGKSLDVRLANDAEPLHNSKLSSDISNHQALHSQKPKQENFSVESSSQIYLASQCTQPAAHLNELSSKEEDREDFKVEDSRSGVNGHVATLNRLPPRQSSPSKRSSPGPSLIHSKKRKKPVPLLIPWYISATQPRDSLPSTSEMELMWANSANRLSDKDDGDVCKDNASSSMKARRRLRSTTQLMQQLIPPLPAELMQGNTPVDNGCATFSLAKFALEDACRLVTNTRREATSAHDPENKNMSLRGQGRTWGVAKSVAVTRCVESFMERARGLESELASSNTCAYFKFGNVATYC